MPPRVTASGLPLDAEQPAEHETPAQRDARMAWWREARFGMFIHWSLYAITAGVWKGQDVPGTSPWNMDAANIPVEEYEQLANQFDPVKYDPAEWVRVARQAGVKYIVITSKNHDGFCLFDTQATDFNAARATPYARDLLKPLARECRRQGIKFCTYYSIMDWHHPAQYRGSPEHYSPTRIHPERKGEYVAFMRQQLRELLEQCDTEVLWFDGEWPAWWTEEDGVELYRYVRGLKPRLIVNNRVGTGRNGMGGLSKGDRQYAGDFGTPEQEVPPAGLPGVDWESCMTINDTWGFVSRDHNWKSAESLIRTLVDIASKGGNLLLNVGPTAEGLIPSASVERLQAIGRWMALNGESIYGTQASPLGALPWGRATCKDLEGGGARLYLHLFDWPADGRLVVPGFHGQFQEAYLLADAHKSPLRTAAAPDGLVVTLPPAAPDPICSVIVLGRDRNQGREGPASR